MLLGYARVSTDDQNLNRQLDQLQKHGVEKRNIYKEKITGTKMNRPELSKLLEFATKGDTIVIADLTRLSRSTKDLVTLSEEFNSKGIELISLKETINTTTATGKMMFGMLSVLAQFERDLISERTKDGLAAARARGHFGGRREKLDDTKKKAVKELYASQKSTLKEICEMFSISVPTLYKIIRES